MSGAVAAVRYASPLSFRSDVLAVQLSRNVAERPQGCISSLCTSFGVNEHCVPSYLGLYNHILLCLYSTVCARDVTVEIDT